MGEFKCGLACEDKIKDLKQRGGSKSKFYQKLIARLDQKPGVQAHIKNRRHFSQIDF